MKVKQGYVTSRIVSLDYVKVELDNTKVGPNHMKAELNNSRAGLNSMKTVLQYI